MPRSPRSAVRLREIALAQSTAGHAAIGHARFGAVELISQLKLDDPASGLHRKEPGPIRAVPANAGPR